MPYASIGFDPGFSRMYADRTDTAYYRDLASRAEGGEMEARTLGYK